MGKSKSKKEQKRLGSTIKYLSFAPNTEVARAVIAGADDKVVRAIANAALNAQQNPAVRLSPADRDLFRRNSHSFDYLASQKHSVKQKRKHILQKGGALPLVIPILASVLGSLGSAFISRAFGGNKEE